MFTDLSNFCPSKYTVPGLMLCNILHVHVYREESLLASTLHVISIVLVHVLPVFFVIVLSVPISKSI